MFIMDLLPRSTKHSLKDCCVHFSVGQNPAKNALVFMVKKQMQLAWGSYHSKLGQFSTLKLLEGLPMTKESSATYCRKYLRGTSIRKNTGGSVLISPH